MNKNLSSHLKLVPKSVSNLDFTRNMHEIIEKTFREARFSDQLEGHLSGLINGEFDKVKRYSTQRLAENFYYCIEWKSEEPRGDVDWYFAEKNIREHFNDSHIRNLIERGIVFSSYDVMPNETAENISSKEKLKLGCNFPSDFSPIIWTRYKKGMKQLPDDEIHKYLEWGKCKFSDDMEPFIGRAVWETYRLVKNMNEFPEEYGRVLIH